MGKSLDLPLTGPHDPWKARGGGSAVIKYKLLCCAYWFIVFVCSYFIFVYCYIYLNFLQSLAMLITFKTEFKLELDPLRNLPGLFSQFPSAFAIILQHGKYLTLKILFNIFPGNFFFIFSFPMIKRIRSLLANSLHNIETENEHLIFLCFMCLLPSSEYCSVIQILHPLATLPLPSSFPAQGLFLPIFCEALVNSYAEFCTSFSVHTYWITHLVVV